jgi:predicted RNase H-like HicB family nuclease
LPAFTGKLAGNKGGRTMKFPVVLHTDDGAHYGVTVPDLPGCFSSGDGIDAALESAIEAIDAHVELLLDDGGDIPELQTIAAHQANPDYAGGVWAIVDAPVEQYFGPADKINITVPRKILVRIDEFAKVHGKSRSGFLVEAATAAMRK